MKFVLVAILAMGICITASSAMLHATIPADLVNDPTRPSTANCSERYYSQILDHFNFAPPPPEINITHFEQRYFVCNEENWKPNQPIFFYTGNECNVELYVNMTGLMWENANTFGALLIFAEHRYFGKSLPFPGEEMPKPPKINYLTTDQALADYATFINALKTTIYNSPNSAVIGFGGSYGGMLCAWLRSKYPYALDGCIAGSAPIANFEFMSPPFDYNSFADTETFDASTAGGATDQCKDNIRQGWKDMASLGATESGRNIISNSFKTCSPLKSLDDVWNFINYASQSFGNMAMSSYPYPSSYLLLGGKGVLPAYPMRLACKFMEQDFATQGDRLSALRQAVGVYYNNTKEVMCLNDQQQVNHATVVTGYLWQYLYCTTMFMPFGQNGVTDMFWNAPWNASSALEGCKQQFDGVETKPDWIQVQYGGYGVGRTATNIVFSNGELDPWKGGGILAKDINGNPNVKTVLIAEAGHHIDLMFSNPKDTPSIKAARKLEVEEISKWIAAKNTAKKN